LKNEDAVLPLAPSGRVAVVGALAEKPRYQGSGSSRVNPTRVVSLLDGVQQYTAAGYVSGYHLTDDRDDALLAEAVRVAEQADRVFVCVGLTDIFESEGFDREHLRLPGNQIALLEALSPVRVGGPVGAIAEPGRFGQDALAGAFGDDLAGGVVEHETDRRPCHASGGSDVRRGHPSSHRASHEETLLPVPLTMACAR